MCLSPAVLFVLHYFVGWLCLPRIISFRKQTHKQQPLQIVSFLIFSYRIYDIQLKSKYSKILSFVFYKKQNYEHTKVGKDDIENRLVAKSFNQENRQKSTYKFMSCSFEIFVYTKSKSISKSKTFSFCWRNSFEIEFWKVLLRSWNWN